jgi:site-specific recombinase XerD
MDTGLALELWLEALEAERRSPRTIGNYRLLGRRLAEALPTLTGDGAAFAIRRALAEYGRTHAPDSSRTLFVGWHSFFNWCVREGLVDRSPMDGMRPPRVPETTREAYSRAEMRSVLGDLGRRATSPIGLRNVAIVSILLDCGLRASELCRLTVGDVGDGVVLVRLTKSGKPRGAPLGQAAEKALSRYLRHGRPKLLPKSDALFVNQFGAAFDRSGLRRVLERAGGPAGIKLAAHRLRHTWATSHLRNGTSTEMLRRLGGWAGHQMVSRYAHALTEDLYEAQRRASPVDRLG